MKAVTFHHRGFMLLECLLALAIFSVAITSIILALKGSNDLVLAIEREQWVQKKFQNVLTLTLKSKQTREEFLTVKNIDFEEFGSTATIEVTEAKIESSSAESLQNLYEVKMTISWYEGSEKRTTTHTTLHHFPLYQY